MKLIDWLKSKGIDVPEHKICPIWDRCDYDECYHQWSNIEVPEAPHKFDRKAIEAHLASEMGYGDTSVIELTDYICSLQPTVNFPSLTAISNIVMENVILTDRGWLLHDKSADNIALAIRSFMVKGEK